MKRKLNFIILLLVTLSTTSTLARYDAISEVYGEQGKLIGGAPYFTSVPGGTLWVHEGNILSFAVVAVDPEGGDISLSAIGLPPGASFLDQGDGTGDFNYSPDFFAAYNIFRPSFIAADVEGLSDTVLVSIIILDVNQPPRINNSLQEVIRLDEGSAYEDSLFASDSTDPQRGPIDLFTVTPLPSGADLEINPYIGRGIFAFSPDYNFTHQYPDTTFQLGIFAIDRQGASSDTLWTTLYVENVNRAPQIFLPDSQFIGENQLLTFTVAAIDSDGDELSFSSPNLPLGASLDSLNGNFLWTPTYQQSGTYNLFFKVGDSGVPPLDDSGWVVITVYDVNQPPIINVPGAQTIDEGDSLHFIVTGEDGDGNALSLTAKGMPENSRFEDNGEGRGDFWFAPDYFQFGNYIVWFKATDNGSPPESDSALVEIEVIDVNRPPVLILPGNQTIKELHQLIFTIYATDPDSDQVFLSARNLPSGATFDSLSGNFQWTPDINQGGTYYITFLARDDGSTPPVRADTGEVLIAVEEVYPFLLEVKKVEGWPGQQNVVVPVFLSSLWDSVQAWEILMYYDPSVGRVTDVRLCDSAVVKDPTSGEEVTYYSPWYLNPQIHPPEYFQYVLNAGGHSNWVQIVGFMDMDWPQYLNFPLPTGDDFLLFSLLVDLDYAGAGHEMDFGFLSNDCTDNTLSGTRGDVLWGPDSLSRPDWLDCAYQPSIRLKSGNGIVILTSVEKGDINCDGIAYSVADAIVFVNYLVYGESALEGFECPPQQQAYASDIDEDGIPWTMQDLVLLLQHLNQGKNSFKKTNSQGIAEVSMGSDETGKISILTDSKNAISVALFSISYTGQIGTPFLTERGLNMKLASNAQNHELKVLIYSLDGNSIAAGKGALFTIPTEGDVQLAFGDVSVFDRSGNPLKVKSSKLSSNFYLAQNYPNPFNPSTIISYQLSIINSPIRTTLKIYNVAGQLVKTLVDEDQEAGEYSVIWDGKNYTGKSVSCGVYFCKLVAGDFTTTRKMIIFK